jgi:hypothetical protein
LRNHAESSIHTTKVHTRSSLPPIHPSLSQDLTWSFEASPRKLEENMNENGKTNDFGYRKMVGAWLHHSPMLALVHHRSNSAEPEFLRMVAHNFVAHLLLGPWKNLLL